MFKDTLSWYVKKKCLCYPTDKPTDQQIMCENTTSLAVVNQTVIIKKNCVSFPDFEDESSGWCSH